MPNVNVRLQDRLKYGREFSRIIGLTSKRPADTVGVCGPFVFSTSLFRDRIIFSATGEKSTVGKFSDRSFPAHIISGIDIFWVHVFRSGNMQSFRSSGQQLPITIEIFG
jgi:hypothetical protein